MSLYSIAAIALASFRGFSRDRIFHATLIFAILFTLFAYLLSDLTIIESRKILIDFGSSSISLSGIIMALIVGVSSVGKEIENKTIYTIVAKPIKRAEYVIGKYIGGMSTLLVAHVFLSIALYGILLQLGEGIPEGLLECCFLMYLESCLLLAVAMCLSLYFSTSFLAASLTIAFFLIGRSAQTFKLVSTRAPNPFMRNVMRAFYDIFPNLDRFNIRELVAYGKPFGEGMVYTSALYFFFYALIFVGFSIFLFEKKDLI